MPLYQKKPLVIEARLYDPAADSDHAADVVAWSGGKVGDGGFVISTKEGDMVAAPGDYVIKEPHPTGDRDFYPCKPEIFLSSYEPIGVRD